MVTGIILTSGAVCFLDSLNFFAASKKGFGAVGYFILGKEGPLVA